MVDLVVESDFNRLYFFDFNVLVHILKVTNAGKRPGARFLSNLSYSFDWKPFMRFPSVPKHLRHVVIVFVLFSIWPREVFAVLFSLANSSNVLKYSNSFSVSYDNRRSSEFYVFVK
jgi:hypothetical protein